MSYGLMPCLYVDIQRHALHSALYMLSLRLSDITSLDLGCCYSKPFIQIIWLREYGKDSNINLKSIKRLDHVKHQIMVSQNSNNTNWRTYKDFFPRKFIYRRKAHHTQQQNYANMSNSLLGCCFYRQSWVLCTLYQHKGNKNTPTNPPQIWSPTISNSDINNTNATGTVNSTIKHQQIQAIKMGNFWLLDQGSQKYLHVYYQPGQETLRDYPTKNYSGAIHQHICLY